LKLHVVFDAQGNILAAARLEAEKAGSGPQFSVRPLAAGNGGPKAGELEVHSEHRHLELPDLCRQFKVDSKGKALALKRKN
jgi:hypothetical protein